MTATGLYGPIRSLLDAAALAPSSHNTQPWLFGFEGNRIKLYADRDRALPENDPDDRELTISCGCALFNLRIAAVAAGYDTAVRLFPEADDADLLASIELEAREAPDEAARVLAKEIPERRTYRKEFRDDEIPDTVCDRLRDAVKLEGARLEFVSADARDDAVRLVREGDAAQWSDSGWRGELADWMHPRSRGDGLPVPGALAPVTRFLVSRIDMGRIVGRRDAELAADAPLLAVLVTDRDERSDWLRAGQALERLLLEASAKGIQASYLNQPIQVATLRSDFEQELGISGAAQLLIRLGYPKSAISGSPRRELENMLEH